MLVTEIIRENDKILFQFENVPESKIVYKKTMTKKDLLKFLNYSKLDIKKIKKYYKLLGQSDYINKEVTYCQFIPLDKNIYKDGEVKEGYF